MVKPAAGIVKGPLRALVRSIQLVALLSVVTGLYLGYMNRDMTFELITLAIGAAIFYFAAHIQRRWL